MGVEAEPTLIEVAPSECPAVSFAAIELLGDVGTEKYFPLLRQAMKSRNFRGLQAAKASLREIRE